MIPAHPIFRVLRRYRGYGYGYGPGQVVCSVLVAEVLQDLGLPIPRGGPVWKAIQLSSPGVGPWAPIAAVNQLEGYGASYPTRDGVACPNPGRLLQCQGWRGLVDGQIVPKAPGQLPSEGHSWFWLADDTDPWKGVAIESSGRGPRIWDANGKHTIGDAIDADGVHHLPLVPMSWSARAMKWTPPDQVRGDQCGVAWTVLS